MHYETDNLDSNERKRFDPRENLIGCHVYAKYQGKNDASQNDIWGVVRSQRVIEGKGTLLVLRISEATIDKKAQYRSIYKEKACRFCVLEDLAPAEYETALSAYDVALAKYEGMAEYTPFNDND